MMLSPERQTSDVVVDARVQFAQAVTTPAAAAREADEVTLDLSRLFARHGVRLTRPHGRTLLEDGVRSDALYMIASGIVRESTLLPDGRRHIVDFLGRGDVYGLSEVAEEQHLVEAETDVTCIALKRTTVHRLASENPAITRTMQRLSERRLAKSHRKMVAMGCLCSVERTAHFLAWLADMHAAWGLVVPMADGAAVGADGCCATPASGSSHVIPMTRREIADYLGLTLETVCRAFSRLKDKGLVDMPTPTSFRIPDRAALDAFVVAER